MPDHRWLLLPRVITAPTSCHCSCVVLCCGVVYTEAPLPFQAFTSCIRVITCQRFKCPTSMPLLTNLVSLLLIDGTGGCLRRGLSGITRLAVGASLFVFLRVLP